MLTRLTEKLYLTKGDKSYVLGCLAVLLLTAIITLAVMAGVEAPYRLAIAPSNYLYWVALSGALGGAVGLYFVRGWMGEAGALGFARAIVGSVLLAIIASVIVGTLTVPFAGTIYAPVVVLSAFIAKPWLAAIWIAGMLGSHYLMSQRAEQRASIRDTHRSVASQLSDLSRAQLYRRN